MRTYQYQARDAEGRVLNGELAAETLEKARQTLAERKVNILEVHEVKKAERASLLRGLGAFGGAARARVKPDEVVVLTRQLATMQGAGIPLAESIEILSTTSTNPGLRKILETINRDIQGGDALSEAMGRFPKVFSSIYTSLIRAAEASGMLDTILDRLAEYQEAAIKLRREIKAAMTYPIISMCMILVIVILLLVFIIPKFQGIFEALGGFDALPVPTKILLLASNFMKQNFAYLAGAAVGAVLLLRGYLKTPRGQYQKDWLVLRLPVFGNLFKKVAISRFARTLATLLDSGVPVSSALEIVRDTVGNRVIGDIIGKAQEEILKGTSMAEVFWREKVFPPMVTRMIHVGEVTGAYSLLLQKISEFYDQQVESTVDGLTSLIEPLLIGFMGVFVGGIVLAVFMPIFSLQKTLAGGSTQKL